MARQTVSRPAAHAGPQLSSGSLSAAKAQVRRSLICMARVVWPWPETPTDGPAGFSLLAARCSLLVARCSSLAAPPSSLMVCGAFFHLCSFLLHNDASRHCCAPLASDHATLSSSLSLSPTLSTSATTSTAAQSTRAGPHEAHTVCRAQTHTARPLSARNGRTQMSSQWNARKITSQRPPPNERLLVNHYCLPDFQQPSPISHSISFHFSLLRPQAQPSSSRSKPKARARHQNNRLAPAPNSHICMTLVCFNAASHCCLELRHSSSL